MRNLRIGAMVGMITALCIAGMAFAQGGGQGKGAQGAPRMGCQDRFDSLDTNKDGKVTKDEFMAVPHYRGNAEEMFKTMDVNGHGYITKDEFCAGKGKGGRMGKGTSQ